MKILLVNCINLDEGLRAQEDSAEHLGILYIASSLRRHFTENELELKVIYGPVFGSTLDDIKPDVVGLSSVSQNYHIAQRYAKICKEKNIPVIVGGVHISTLPHTLTGDMDVGIINEGEDAIVELMRIFMEDKAFVRQKLACVEGIVYHDGNELVKTQFRERIKDLDTLPIPDREFYDHPRRGIFTSRGCPYDCVFCFSKPFWGPKARFFSPEYVVKEMADIVERFNVSQISIYDDLFIAPRVRFKKMVELIRAAGLHKKITFNCNVRPNEITDEVAELLKSMSITHVFLGIESGNQRVLKYLKKQACSVEQNRNAIRILKKHGILTHGGFIIGSPDETREEIMDTYRFIRKSGIDSFSPLMLTPLPGTPVWDIAKKKGLVSDFMDWNILREEFNEVESRHIVMSEVLSREELARLYRKFKRLQKRKYFYLALKHPLMGMREAGRLAKRQFHYMSLLLSKYKGGNSGEKGL
ncbi:MAG TPA: radical SAM protein [Thermodesulfobacteriota bacterium]|nr:radical SAM protein [Thermodesulfobacteriota bacterium]